MASSSSSELSLDYKLSSFSMSQNQNPFTGQMQKLQEFLSRLEEERLKIEAFKRELPLCMQLLNNAMEAYRKQLETCQASQGSRPPVLEEFIPLRNESAEESEKASWLVSAQIWRKQEVGDVPMTETEERSVMNLSSKLVLETRGKINGGAFQPFSKEREKRKDISELGLAHDSMDRLETGEKESTCSNKGGLGSEERQCKGAGSCCDSGEAVAPAVAIQRKSRRCWSPELHRRFVNALQILGGSQVATPKQIRELMKVDGLTNDEVKSHLQKYRLHTRRPMQPPPPPAATVAPQLVVLGGIWVPPEYATSAAAAAAVSTGSSLYGAHPSQSHYCTQPPPSLYHLASLLPSGGGGGGRALTAYKERRGSPESEVRSGGERSESMDEEEEEVVVELVSGVAVEDVS